LRKSVQQFIVRLEGQPDIDLLGVYCESRGRTARAVFSDLWRRRKLLAVPLALLEMAQRGATYLRAPGQEADLKRSMDRLAARIHYVSDLHDVAVLDEIRRLAPDLGLIYGSPILKPELFEIPRLGTLGIHHGKMPEYRGKKTTFWALYNGERTAGVTIQKVNAGLDTGTILKQAEVPADRPLRRVWKELEALGYELYIQAILDARVGAIKPMELAGNRGKLYRDPEIPDLIRFCFRRWRRRPDPHESRG